MSNISLQYANWKCPVGCGGSYYVTIGIKNNEQISEVATCGICGTTRGWRKSYEGSSVQLLDVPNDDDTPIRES